MRRVKSDVREGKYRRALDRVVLRLMCTRSVIETKDNALLFLTAVNLLNVLPSIELDRDLLTATDLTQFLFQVFYNKSAMPSYLIEKILLVLAPLPDDRNFVVLAVAMICIVIKWSRSKSL